MYRSSPTPPYNPPRMQHRWLTFVVLPLIAIVLTLPVLAVLASWLQWDAQTAQILREMRQTVLPGYVLTTLTLCTMVAVGTMLVGTATAAAVTLFDFKRRKTLEW